MTNQPLHDTILVPNLLVRSAISEWRDKHTALT